MQTSIHCRRFNYLKLKFNYLNYLLSMSIQFRCYKEVSRGYIQRWFDEVNEECQSDFCTNCKEIKHIRSELFKKGYDSFNKHVKWWRILHRWAGITVEPIHDEVTD